MVGRGGTEELLGLIEHIYEAATDSALMQGLPLRVATHFGSESCLFHFCYKPPPGVPGLPRNACVPIGTANFDAQACAAYAEYYHERNEWYARGWKKGFPVVVLGQELMSTNALQRTEWFDYCRTTGMYELIGAQTLISGDLICAIGIHRPQGSRAFDEDDQKELSFVLPHLQRAFQMHERLGLAETRGALAFDLMDNIDVGVAIVDADGKLLLANRVADRILSREDGLRVSQGRVRPVDSRQEPGLARAITQAARTGGGKAMAAGGVAVLTRRSGSGMTVLVSPLRIPPQNLGTSVHAAALIFCDPDRETIVPEHVLAAAHGLTIMEARLLAALVTGKTVSEFAESADIGIGTARTHLKHILGKTGYHRQADLMRDIAANPVMKLAAHMRDDFRES